MMKLKRQTIECVCGLHPRRALGTLAIQASAAVLAWAFLPGATEACGPYLPCSILESDEAVVSAPVGDLARELLRIRPPLRARHELKRKRDWSPRRLYDQTAEAGLADLTAALKAVSMTRSQRQEAVVAWRRYRKALDDWRKDQYHARLWRRPEAEPNAPSLPPLPEALPKEFTLYLQGATAYHAGQMARAREYWSAVLELPAGRRRYRSTWASYMLGRSYVDTDPDAAGRWFGRTRQLADSGFADSLNLAAASLGWQGRAELKHGRLSAAAGLYLAQLHAGDGSAVASLTRVARRALTADDARRTRAAGDRTLRQVVTSWLVSRGGAVFWTPQPKPALARRWLAAIEAAGVRRVQDADRLAWLAYQAGQFKAADRWLARADGNEPMALWVRAKLLMRSGERERAVAVLARTVRAMSTGQIWTNRWNGRGYSYALSVKDPRQEALAELGALQLAGGQFVESLHVLLASGYWRDAAYVAERVLTADELKAYVDRHCPAPETTPELDEDGELPVRPRLRHLLARRLTRLGRWKEARPYFRPHLREKLDAYIAAIRRGHNASLSPARQAEAFWKAAKIARYEGMSLLSSELAPDGHIYHGDFQPGDARREPSEQRRLIASSQAERRRATAHTPVPNKRYHYRYTALQHAWAALQRMPDNDVLTARRFIMAGSWVKAKDPNAADRFYKALVNRCGQTELGRQADRLRWFPPLEQRAAP